MTPEQRARALELEAEGDLAAFEFARAQGQQKKPKEKKESWYEDLGEGLVVSGLETYQGIKDLVSELDEDDRATMADWRQDASESGWGTAGQVVGDIGQMVVPGGAALRGLKAAGKIKDITQGMRLGADIAGGTALGFIQSPTEGESRLSGAAEGLIGGAAGGLLGKALSKLGRGISRTDDAQRLMDEGIELTPGQASESTVWRGLENVMSFTPTLGKGVNELRDTALAQWNLKILNEALPPGAKKLETIGYEANEQIADAFKTAYSNAWNKAKRPSGKQLFDIVRSAGLESRRLDEPSRTVVRRLMEDITQLSNDYTPERMRALDNSVRKAINNANSKANPNPYLSDALKGIKDKLREATSQEARDELALIDQQYRKFLTARKASTSDFSEGAGGTFTPQDLMKATKRIGGESTVFVKGGPLQESAEQGLVTLGRKEPKPIINIRKALARNMYSPTPVLDLGGRMLMGRTAPQRAAQAMADSPLAQALRGYGVRAAPITAGYIQEDY
jgi:hypothetical protein